MFRPDNRVPQPSADELHIVFQDGQLLSDMRSATGHPVELLPPLVVLELPEFGQGGFPMALVLCHYPMAQWDRSHHGSWHLYGHCRGSFENGGLSFDVGVDCHGFRPISVHHVAERMSERSPHSGTANV